MARIRIIPWEQLPEEHQPKVRALWSAGRLSYKLHSGQAAVWSRFHHETDGRIFVLDCARRWGKTFLGLCIDVAKAITLKNARISVAAPEQKMVREIILPLLQAILADCPPELRPELNKSEGAWTFPTTGSRMVVAGCDKNPNALRGTHMDHGHVIEAGFVRDLDYVVGSILVPQMQGRPHARLFMESTPPTSPLHSWSTRYVPEAQSSGNYAKQTIEDNPLLSAAEVAEFNEMAGGMDSTTCRRENYAEHVVDEESSIVPEFRKVRDEIVKEHRPPRFYDSYVSMDPGQVDLWAVLFGFYDFEAAKLIIQDEVVVNRETTKSLADAINAKERALWSDRELPHNHGNKPTHEPLKRVSDTELQVIYDLQHLHGLKFIPTAKDDKLAALNAMRLWIQQGRIIIHPRCKTLISHLEFGVWNRRKTSYERVEGQGHFDCIDALVYLVRNVAENRNPIPPLLGIHNNQHFMTKRPEPTQEAHLAEMFKGAFGR